MAFNKRTWLGRQGTGLNKFSIDGATPVTIVNQPDSVTQVGDALSAGNLNDLEDRIEDAFDDVDTALDTKADEQDVTNLNNALTALDHRLENIEQSKGDYIVSAYKDGSITPSGKGAWAVVEGLRGVSRCENNLSEASATHYQNDVHVVKNSDGSVTLDGTASAGGSLSSHNNVPITVGHCYLLSMVGDTNKAQIYSDINGNKAVTVAVITANSGSTVTLRASSGTVFSNNVYWVMTTDLNVYFGTMDLSFLGADDSAKLATIQKDYPHLLLPSDYGVRIVDAGYTGVRAWGVNIWDEEWEANGLSYSTGLPDDTRTNRIRSKNFIPCSPLEPLYFLMGNGVSDTSWMYFYDSSYNFISTRININGSGSFTPVAGASYMKFESYASYGSTYNYNIQIADNDSSTKTTYHPYMTPSTLSFPSTSLKSAGSVREKYLLESGEVTHPLGTITFNGTENWLKSGSSGAFYLTTNRTTFPYKFASDVQALSIYPFLGTGGQSADVLANADKAFGLYCMPDPTITVREIWIKDTFFAGTDAWKAYLAQNPLTVYYELETADPSTPATAITDNTLLTEAYGRLSTVQTGTIVDGIADLGFITL